MIDMLADMRATLAEFETRRDEASAYATGEREEFIYTPAYAKRTREEWATSATYWTGRVNSQRTLIAAYETGGLVALNVAIQDSNVVWMRRAEVQSGLTP